MTTTKTTRRRLFALLGSSVLTACAAPAVVTRDDRDPFEGGIGGTGIVGTLTGFGSLRINGLTVETTGRTRYRAAFGAAGPDALAQGQLLTVFAERTQTGLVARDVSIDHALVGRLRVADGVASVNGVRLSGRADPLGRATPGMRVAVSGVWTRTGVWPGRIDPATDGPDLIAGTAARDGDGTLRIGGVPVSGRSGVALVGRYVIARGRDQGDAFAADRIEVGRFSRLARLDQLSAEGYLEPSATAPGLRIAGLGHNFARDVRLAAIGPRRALFFGDYDGVFGARRGYVVPDALSARAPVLAAGLGDGFEGPVIDL